MALNKKQIAALFLRPFLYGLERTFKAEEKIEFAIKHYEKSGYARPISMVRNGTVVFFGMLGGISCGISGGMAMGAAFGSVVPVFGTFCGALIGGLGAGLLGCTAGTLVTKHAFRFVVFMTNRLTDRRDPPLTNAGKYKLAGNLRSSPAQILLTEIGRKKFQLKQAAGGDFLTVFGDETFFFNSKQKKSSANLTAAAKLLHENPEDNYGVAQARVLESDVNGVVATVEKAFDNFKNGFRP